MSRVQTYRLVHGMPFFQLDLLSVVMPSRGKLTIIVTDMST
jgi:hypothetical protein